MNFGLFQWRELLEIKGVSAVFLPPENQGCPVTTLFPYCTVELEHSASPGPSVTHCPGSDRSCLWLPLFV